MFSNLSLLKPLPILIKIRIVDVIYRSNSQPKADIDIFTKTLDGVMNIITNANKHSTMMGYFNIDLLKYNYRNKSKHLC